MPTTKSCRRISFDISFSYNKTTEAQAKRQILCLNSEIKYLLRSSRGICSNTQEFSVCTFVSSNKINSMHCLLFPEVT